MRGVTGFNNALKEVWDNQVAIAKFAKTTGKSC